MKLSARGLCFVLFPFRPRRLGRPSSGGSSAWFKFSGSHCFCRVGFALDSRDTAGVAPWCPGSVWGQCSILVACYFFSFFFRGM